MIAVRFNFLIPCTVLAIISFALSLYKGSTSIHLYQLFNNSDALSHDIFFNVRLPRTCCAFVTGGLLALAGSLMQVLLRNPLADPYVLGTSGGAAVATLALMLCGVTGLGLTLGAWAGSLAAIVFVFMLAQGKNTWHAEHLILVGIAIASGFSAIISLILLISPDHALRSMLFWLVGDLSESSIPVFASGLLITGLAYALMSGSELNLLIRGEKEAWALGVNVQRLKIKLFLLSSILTATAVTLAGCIGFVGLIVPHLLRLLGGHDHRLLLPGSVLLGGSLLTIADTISRTWFAPQQLPVGIIMAFIGIPAFLFLIQRK